MAESRLTKLWCDRFKRVNAKVWVLSASARQSAGVPDRFIAHTLWCGHMEFKVGHNGESRAQTEFRTWANKDGRLKSVTVWLEKDRMYCLGHWHSSCLSLLEFLNEEVKRVSQEDGST